VSVNGKKVKDPNTRLSLNDDVKFAKFLMQLNSPIKETRKQLNLTEEQIKEVRSWVLYMNDEVIVINKPPGLAVQGGTNILLNLDSILSALQYDYADLPKSVHRLDKSTSGVLVLARNRSGAVRMSEWFRDHDSGHKKVYWAIVNGKPRPTNGRVKTWVKKVDELMTVMEKPDKESRLAITEYETLDTAQQVSLLCLIPLTGRTHQLRVHCATALGAYILGDRKYGFGVPESLPSLQNEDNIYLHAREISLPYLNEHKKRVIVQAPLFDHFRHVMKTFGFSEGDYGSILKKQAETLQFDGKKKSRK
jgi:23S rRNA pseudouridine955/2504/2580 synthase